MSEEIKDRIENIFVDGPVSIETKRAFMKASQDMKEKYFSDDDIIDILTLLFNVVADEYREWY